MDNNRLDYMIARLLNDNGRASNRDMAKKLGVSETTIRNRVQKLLREKSLFIIAVPNPTKLSAGILGEIHIKVRAEKKEEIGKKLLKIESLWYVCKTAGTYDFDCEFFVKSQKEMSEMMAEIEKINGTISVDFSIILEHLKYHMKF